MLNAGRWCLGGSMVLMMVALLAACGDGSDRQPTGGVSPSGAEPSLTADRTVTLKVTGMKKSGGGSTWMSWPDSVQDALEGLPGVESVEVDLDREQFKVTSQPDQPAVEEMLSVVRKLGYGAEIVATGKQEQDKPVTVRGQRASGPMPAVIQEALDQAREQDKLLIVDFYATWCPPCKRMLKETWSDPRVVEKLERFLFLKVNTDEHPEAAKHFGVKGVPDARILTPDGTELAQIFNFRPADEVLEILESAVAGEEE